MTDSRKAYLYTLTKYQEFLKKTLSFSDEVCKCNFNFRGGWSSGKTYVTDHNIPEWKPELRGIHVLDLYYITADDYVILTDDQYADLKYAIESGY